MKSIKISEAVHDELKVYAAKSKENISDISGYAIMEYLKLKGHKFLKPKKQYK